MKVICTPNSTPSTLGGVILLHNKEETIGSKNQQRDPVLQ